MVAYNFQPRFVPAILDRTKRQTVRAERTPPSHHVRPGDRMQLYIGLRTPDAQKIGDACASIVEPIRLHLTGEQYIQAGHVLVRGIGRLDDFAQQDGFADWPELLTFWAEHHPGIDTFEGVLIRWVDFRPHKAVSVTPD